MPKEQRPVCSLAHDQSSVAKVHRSEIDRVMARYEKHCQPFNNCQDLQGFGVPQRRPYPHCLRLPSPFDQTVSTSVVSLHAVPYKALDFVIKPSVLFSLHCICSGQLSRAVPAVTFPGSRKSSGASVPIVAVALGLPTRDGPATRAAEHQTLTF